MQKMKADSLADLVNIAASAFIAPFVVFSATAGQLAGALYAFALDDDVGDDLLRLVTSVTGASFTSSAATFSASPLA